MSRGKELIKNTAIVAVGKVCTKFLSFFLLPFYTAVLSREDYGIVDLINTYISLLLPLIVFQIEDAIFRFTIEVRSNEQEKRKVISTAVFFCIVQSIIFSGLFWIVQMFIDIPYKEYLYINVLVSIFSGMFLQLTRGLGDNMGYAFGSFLVALIAILMNMVLVLVFHMGADGLFITAFLSNLIGVFYILFRERLFRYIRMKWFDKELLKKMLSYSLPLVPNTLSWWVIGASDKSVVTWFLGTAENGILSVSQKFSTVYTTFYSIFNLTWTESASVHKDDSDSEQYYSQIIDTSFRVLSGACIGIIAVVALVFPILVNQKFDASYYQIPIYMLSSLIYSVIGIYSVVYIAFKKTGNIAKTSMIAAAINLFLNILLIRYIGLYAASISSVVAYAVMLLIRYFDIQKYVKVRTNKAVVISVFFVMILQFVFYYMRNFWLSICNLLFVIVYVLYLNRSFISEISAFAKKKIGKARETKNVS